MKSEIFDFMAIKSAFMGFSRYFHEKDPTRRAFYLSEARNHLLDPKKEKRPPTA